MLYTLAALSCVVIAQAAIDWDALPVVEVDGVKGVYEEWTTNVNETPKKEFVSLEKLRALEAAAAERRNRRRLANADQLSSSDKADMLTKHNSYRSQVAVGSLGSQPAASDMTEADWNEAAGDFAAEYLQQCNYAHTSSSYGENLYIKAGYGDYEDISYINEAVVSWVEGEYPDYTYSSRSCSGTCGHYTQVVWADSTSVGCAYSTSCACGDLVSGWDQYPSCLYVICEYSPAGNYGGQWPYSEANTCNDVTSECPNGWAANKDCGMCFDEGTGSDGCYETNCEGQANDGGGDGGGDDGGDTPAPTTPSPTGRPTTDSPTDSGDGDGGDADGGDVDLDDCDECTVKVEMIAELDPYDNYADVYYACRDFARSSASDQYSGVSWSSSTSWSYSFQGSKIIWTTGYSATCGDKDRRDALYDEYISDDYRTGLIAELDDIEGYLSGSLVINVEKSTEDGAQAYDANGDEDSGSSGNGNNKATWWIWLVVILVAVLVGSGCGFGFAMWRAKQDAKQLKHYQQMTDIQY